MGGVVLLRVPQEETAFNLRRGLLERLIVSFAVSLINREKEVGYFPLLRREGWRWQ